MEPKYDEDLVNLGYLKKYFDESESLPAYISRHYSSQPKPPYYAGDTWVDGNIVYTCIQERLIGVFNSADWTTESGAKQEAENKNKTYLEQPSNYKPGDLWILQSNDDHRAGKKGEVLVSTVGRSTYNADDWVNMLGYEAISINEVLHNLSDAIDDVTVASMKQDGLITLYYTDYVPVGATNGDLWFVIDDVTGYDKECAYQYNGTNWNKLNNTNLLEAMVEAKENRITSDGKIQSFYSEEEPSNNVGDGDLWTDTSDNDQLYRYNGTNWVEMYDTRKEEVAKNVDSVTRRVASIETDLGEIDLKVTELEETQEENKTDLEAQINIKANEVTTNVSNSVTDSFMRLLNNGYLTAEQVQALVDGNTDEIATIKNQLQQTVTDTDMQIAITTALNGGVSYFKNTLFTLNDEGLWIATSADEFNAKYDNTGMYLYSFEEMIAKYTKDGAELKNLKVNGEIQTGNLRIMDVVVNNEKRTHIHWIGG